MSKEAASQIKVHTPAPARTVTTGLLQRACACGNHTSGGGECESCRKKKASLQRSPAGRGGDMAGQSAPPIVHEVLREPGRPLDAETRAELEPRFGRDFSQVRVHTSEMAADSAQSVRAKAYTIGQRVVFGAGQYHPDTSTGRRLLAHELTHTIQQQGTGTLGRMALDISDPESSSEKEAERISNAVTQDTAGDASSAGGTKIEQPAVNAQVSPQTISREPTFPDATCNPVQSNIVAAWPTAAEWVSNAISRLSNPSSVSGALQTHFKLNPDDTAQASDLATVRQVFSDMRGLLSTDINNVCTPAGGNGGCQLPDGREYAAFVRAGRPELGITHCLTSADAGFLSRQSLIETIVHEIAHLADPASRDFAYRHAPGRVTYAQMTRAQAVHNGDSYSEFAQDLFIGASLSTVQLTLSTGVLLSEGRPRWAIRAGFDVRSQTGIEVFDLVGGVAGFIALDVAAQGSQPVLREYGGEANIGFISRSAQTSVFVDTRLGIFGTADAARREPDRLGLSSSTLIGWGDSRFRTGINLRLLYDFLQNNHAVIIGGEFRWGP